MQVQTSGRRQRGAMIITTALVLLFLLGFMGIALDFGHLFVVRTELQTAVDSCALAAARELDKQETAIARAQSAGQTAGNANRVNMQSATWSGQGQLVFADITFRDASYAPTIVPSAARYAQCVHTQPNIVIWLLKAMGAFSGNVADYPATGSVAATAVATRASAQTTCPIPVAFRPDAGEVAPDYGLEVGEWVPLIQEQSEVGGGEIGWANLDGSNGTDETIAELNNHCGTEVGDELGTPGVKAAVVDVWNQRFGIYKNSGDPSVQQPDYTGYVYTALTWPAQSNAFDDFLAKRAGFASCVDTGKVKDCEDLTGLSLNSFQKLAASGNVAGGHKQYGLDRRIVTVPVIDESRHVVDYLCMLMLQPMSIPMTNTWLEFRGNAGAPNSPCTTSGLAGGTAGPLVPVLVR